MLLDLVVGSESRLAWIKIAAGVGALVWLIVLFVRRMRAKPE
jgi:hypothetical protein